MPAERFAPPHVQGSTARSPARGHCTQRRSADRMNRQLKRPERFPIVAAMKKSACLLMFLLLAAPAALAQSSQFGLMLGGSKRLISQLDREEGVPGVQDNWKFGNSVKEAFYAIE